LLKVCQVFIDIKTHLKLENKIKNESKRKCALLKLAKWQEEFEDTKEVIRIRKSMKYKQHNGQTKKDKMTNHDLQNIYIKLKIE